VAFARAACAVGSRVWWVALPHQRPYVFKRVTSQGGAVLGLEVVGAQQAYYRLLSAVVPGELKPLVVGTARVVLVAEALQLALGGPPTPGEARLFAAGIAEAKRYEVPPAALRGLAADPEVERLAAVYQAYCDLLGDRWDYDDVRSAAARLVGSEAFSQVMGDPRARAKAGLPDAVVVDGWRELGPLDWRFLEGIARHVPVHVTLPAAPHHRAPDEVLPPLAAATEVRRYAAVNAVDEARWVLRSLKRDIAEGLDPLDLAVVAPGGTGDALAALADEYGVPLVDERGAALGDTPLGRALIDLLELRASPTPARLLAVPGLAPVAYTAMRLGLTGADALARVARELGLHEELAAWLEKLEAREDPVAWTRWLLDEVLASVHEVEPLLRERVLAAAQHASRLGTGERFQEWLAALLRDTRSSPALTGGIALLDADLASGRRFARCYVMGAVVGQYTAGEREDYFVPDEARSAVPGLGCLPRRFAGGDDLVVAELLSRGRVTVVTAPLAGPEGRLVPDERLTGDPSALERLPVLPAGSPLEVLAPEPYRPAFELDPAAIGPPAAADGEPDLEWLRELVEECALKAWGERALRLDGPGAVGEPDELRAAEDGLRRLIEGDEPGGGGWHDLLAALKAEPSLSPQRLRSVAQAFPWAAEWLEEHAERLTCLSWNARVARSDLGVSAHVDAAQRLRFGGGGQKAALFRFVPPAPAFDQDRARQLQRARWTEYLAASALLNHRTQGVALVEVHVWPVLGKPVWVEYTRSDFMLERIAKVEEGVATARRILAEGRLEPNPEEHRCKRCRVASVCRMGELP
jgi:ATP-dependent helicase/nuclease subunit B